MFKLLLIIGFTLLFVSLLLYLNEQLLSHQFIFLDKNYYKNNSNSNTYANITNKNEYIA